MTWLPTLSQHPLDSLQSACLGQFKAQIKTSQVDGLTITLPFVLSAQNIEAIKEDIVRYSQQAHQPIDAATIRIDMDIPTFSCRQPSYRHPQIKNIIAVCSGKGGVGKSTVSVQLAYSLHRLGARVAILDADIYGPNIPTMLSEQPIKQQTFKPLNHHGVASMSLGYLVDPKQAALWRGPMLSQALLELLTKTQWPKTDYLIIDMPPGTGDIALTLSKKTPLTAAVIVSTSQRVAHDDVCRSVGMCHQLDIPLLGAITNMETITCPHCHHSHALYPTATPPNTIGDLCKLGTIPFDTQMASYADQGKVYVIEKPQSDLSLNWLTLASNVSKKIAELPLEKPMRLKEIKVQQQD